MIPVPYKQVFMDIWLKNKNRQWLTKGGQKKTISIRKTKQNKTTVVSESEYAIVNCNQRLVHVWLAAANQRTGARRGTAGDPTSRWLTKKSRQVD